MSVRLLVADDAPFIQEIIKHLVEKTGIQIVGEAYDGNEAVEIALRTKPDVILMDIVMPKKSGLEAAREILKKLPRTRIIACSTVNNETLVMRAVEAGCCDFVTKPFSGQALLQVIKSSRAALEGDL